MRQFLITNLFVALTSCFSTKAQSIPIDFSKVKSYENQLEDVTEIIDTTKLKTQLQAVENDYKNSPSTINEAKLGIIYHEVALNLSFLSNSSYKGYAQKSFDLLTNILQTSNTPKELFPIVSSYRASALALVGAETKKLNLVNQSFRQFAEAVKNYSSVSSYPEFLRGSVAENLPKIFFLKRKLAKKDFQSIIEKQSLNKQYANWKIMSFTYWAWANQRQQIKYRKQALAYLEKAILLDPESNAGRKKAEELKAKLLEKNGH